MKSIIIISAVSLCFLLIFSINSCQKDSTTPTPELKLATLTTIAVSEIRQNSAVSGGSITSDGGATITTSGVCWGSSINPTTSELKTTENVTTGQFVSNITGLTDGSTYHVRAYATNSVGTAYGNDITFTTVKSTIVFNPDLTYGAVTDIDGNIYKTIQIGAQTWMAENLKTIKYNDGNQLINVTDDHTWQYQTKGAYCNYNNDPVNSDTYGKLYNGWVAVYYRNGINVCPTGWHIPSVNEWQQLMTYLGGYFNIAWWEGAGGKLKEIGITHWESPNGEATNESGFTALPSGRRGNLGNYYNMSVSGEWWSSNSAFSSSTEFSFSTGSYDATMHQFDLELEYGLPIRCLKDN